MPPAGLTQLGRQLRFVLANLSPQLNGGRLHNQTLCLEARGRFVKDGCRPICSNTPVRVAVATSLIENESYDTDPTGDEDVVRGTASRMPRLRRTGLDDSLKRRNRDNTTQDMTLRKIRYISSSRDTEHGPVRTISSRTEHVSKRPNLRLVTNNYIHRRKAFLEFSPNDQTGQNERAVLRQWEIQFIRSRGYSPEDVQAWANIVLNGDLESVLQYLSRAVEHQKVIRMPTFLIMHLLRREHINAQLLRILIKHSSLHFGDRAALTRDPPVHIASPAPLIDRLLRHARRVWPQAMEVIVQLLLQYLHRSRNNLKAQSSSGLRDVTLLLNRTMSLLSYKTAVHPFKDIRYQEAAAVRILKYMTEHHPPLHINREGYRAITRLQLGQRKTQQEQQWAELKARSWPPWKEDRTAMDSMIEPKHGISKAGSTLIQMYEAGYSSSDWEKAAQVYTGWDVDGTPTIQMRAHIGRPGRRFLKGGDPWAARILATRTIQEAWACYLAWADKKLPQDQEVYLAVFQNLYEEEKRIKEQLSKAATTENEPRGSWPLHPGDGREVQPLPPSTHLHTYTSTTPPSPEQFYDQLHSRGVMLRNHCLAFVVANARTLQIGVRYLRDSTAIYPQIEDLLLLRHDQNWNKIPAAVLLATIELFARHKHMSLYRILPQQQFHLLSNLLQRDNLPGYFLNEQSSFVRAVDLAIHLRITHAPTWNSIFQGLASGRPPDLLKPSGQSSHRREYTRIPDSRPEMSPEMMPASTHINSFDLVCRFFPLLDELQIELDEEAFFYLCCITQNLVLAINTVHRDGAAYEPGLLDKYWTRPLQQGIDEIMNTGQQSFITARFRRLVGEDSDPFPQSDGANLERTSLDIDTIDLPRLLTVPRPYLLHHYVRALGWTANYDGIYHLVQWMSEHRTELAERASEDRQSVRSMRKVMVALRVFLERSWLQAATPEDERSFGANAEEAGMESEPNQAAPGSDILQRLRTPASVETTALVREIVNSVEEWKGWPSDDEVEVYCQDKYFSQFGR